MIMVRPYTPADQAQVEWLYARTPPAGSIAVRPQTLPEDMRRIEEVFAAFFVAVEPCRGAEAVVGMAGVANPASQHLDVPPPAFIGLAAAARLHHVAVAPERWRHSIGRMLVEAAVGWCRDSGYRSLFLATTPQQEAAVALYASLGFDDRGRTTFGVYDIVWMELALSTKAQVRGRRGGRRKPGRTGLRTSPCGRSLAVRSASADDQPPPTTDHRPRPGAHS